MATTPVDLYRTGITGSARLDKLRGRDVDIYTDPAWNEICVRVSNTKGVSCWDSVGQLVNLTGKAWQLPANSTYDDTRLLLWETRPGSGHWNWTPARDMPWVRVSVQPRQF